MAIDQHLISHFPYLAALYRHQSFTKGAASLFISQTAMSYQIKKLEGKLDCQLVLRQSGSRMRFTADGETLAKAYLLCERQLALAINGIDREQGRGTLRLSTPIDLGSMVMPRVISKIKEQAPRLDVELHSSDQNISLENSKWDIAIRSQLDYVEAPIFSSPIFLVAGKDYYFNKPPPVTLEEALNECTVLLRQDSNQGSWRALLGYAPTFQSTLTLGTTLGMREASKENLGVALLPEFVIRSELAKGELVQLFSEETSKLSVYFSILSIEGPQIDNYCHQLREAFIGV